MTDIVLPSAPVWAQRAIAAIFNASGSAELTSAVDAFIAPHAHITVNGKHVSRAQYQAHLASEKAAERPQNGAQLTFVGSVATPSGANLSGGVSPSRSSASAAMAD